MLNESQEISMFSPLCRVAMIWKTHMTEIANQSIEIQIILSDKIHVRCKFKAQVKISLKFMRKLVSTFHSMWFRTELMTF